MRRRCLDVQIPFSPWGDGNSLPPCQALKSIISDTLLPVRGRKRWWFPTFSDGYTSSDTLLPVRGRKPVCTGLGVICCLFRYLSPREGTETPVSYRLIDLLMVQIPYSPWGDENNYTPKADILRLRIQIPFSPRGDGNRCCQRLNNSLPLFRYLTPREGTETLCIRLGSPYNRLFRYPYSPNLHPLVSTQKAHMQCMWAFTFLSALLSYLHKNIWSSSWWLGMKGLYLRAWSFWQR